MAKLTKQFVEETMTAAIEIAANPQIHSSEECNAANLTRTFCEEWLAHVKEIAKLSKPEVSKTKTQTKRGGKRTNGKRDAIQKE